MLGVPSVYCGFRTTEGELLEIKKYSMKALERIGICHWSPSEPLSCLHDIIKWIKEKLEHSSMRNRKDLQWLKCNPEVCETFTLSRRKGTLWLYREDYPELR